MELTAQPVHHPIDSTLLAPHLLSLPQELLAHIVELVVLQPDPIYVRHQCKRSSDGTRLGWQLATSNPGFLNLAKTCRQLYWASIKLAYARNTFKYGTATPVLNGSCFVDFHRQIAPANAECITSVCLHRVPLERELGILPMFSALREFRIDETIWEDCDGGNKERALCNLLRQLRFSDIPALCHLHVDVKKIGLLDNQEVLSKRVRNVFDRKWTEIESAVDAVRDTIFSEGIQTQIHLSETEHWHNPDHYSEFVVRRRYISVGVYERIGTT